MKKISSFFLGLTLLLSLAACGSDEPRDAIYYAQIYTVNHVTDKENTSLVGCQTGGISAGLNATKMIASVYFPFTIGDKVITINLENVPMTNDSQHSGYSIKQSAFTSVDGQHSITDFEFFVDMRMIKSQRHYITAIIDGKYELNALVQTMAFEKANSTVKPTSGNEVTDNTGTFTFAVTNINGNDGKATAAINGLSIYPLTKEVSYQGITLEATYDGFHISHSGDPIEPYEGGSHYLESMNADINVHTRTFTAEYKIQQCGNVKASGAMF